SSHVHESARRTVLPQAILRGLRTHEKPRVGQGGSHGPNFVQDLGGEGVRNAEDKRFFPEFRLLRTTQVIHAGARGIGNGELIDEKMLPVKQGMKRQIMQEIMGHHDEVTRLKLVPNRGKQLFVQLAKMRCSVETPGGETHVADGAGRVLLWSNLVHVDLALAPIYFLAQLLYLPHAIAESAGGRGQDLSMKGNQICQTA